MSAVSDGDGILNVIADEDANSGDTDSLIKIIIDGTKDTGTQKGKIGYDQGLDRLVFGYGNNDHIQINSTGITQFTSQIRNKLITISSATYSTSGDYAINQNYADTNTSTITLSTADVLKGLEMHIKDSAFNAATNSIHIETQGAETIDEAANYEMNTDGESITFYSDGTNWFIR